MIKNSMVHIFINRVDFRLLIRDLMQTTTATQTKMPLENKSFHEFTLLEVLRDYSSFLSMYNEVEQSRK